MDTHQVLQLTEWRYPVCVSSGVSTVISQAVYIKMLCYKVLSFFPLKLLLSFFPLKSSPFTFVSGDGPTGNMSTLACMNVKLGIPSRIFLASPLRLASRLLRCVTMDEDEFFRMSSKGLLVFCGGLAGVGRLISSPRISGSMGGAAMRYKQWKKRL